MHRLLLSCLTVVAFMTSQVQRANSFELGMTLHEQKKTSEKCSTLLDPRATPCLDIVTGCSDITIGQSSIELLEPELSVGLDGSLTITAIGSWTNTRELKSHRGKVIIRIPKQLRPLALPGSKGSISQTTLADMEETCSVQAPTTGKTLSLAHLSEVLMGQKAISQSAALFTPRCQH